MTPYVEEGGGRTATVEVLIVDQVGPGDEDIGVDSGVRSLVVAVAIESYKVQGRRTVV